MNTKTAGQLLCELLVQKTRESGKPKTDKGKSELAKALGLDYKTINRWSQDKGFDEANQKRVIAHFRLPHDYFVQPALGDIRELERRAAFASFLRSAAELPNQPTARELAFLDQITFPDPTIQPNAEWYMSNLAILRNAITPSQAENALANSKRIDAEIAVVERETQLTQESAKRLKKAVKRRVPDNDGKAPTRKGHTPPRKRTP